MFAYTQGGAVTPRGVKSSEMVHMNTHISVGNPRTFVHVYSIIIMTSFKYTKLFDAHACGHMTLYTDITHYKEHVSAQLHTDPEK